MNDKVLHYGTPLPPEPGDWIASKVITACGIVEPPIASRTGYRDSATCPTCRKVLAGQGVHHARP